MSTFECLRQANASEILAATGIATAQSGESFPWVPLLDGDHGVIPDLPSTLWENGVRISRRHLRRIEL
jgi:acetylcholinesterase